MGNALYTFDNFNIQLLSFLLLSIVLKRKIFITYFCLLDSAFRGLSKFSQGKPKFNSLRLSLPFGLSFVYFYCIKECVKAQEVSWARPVLQTVPVPSPHHIRYAIQSFVLFYRKDTYIICVLGWSLCELPSSFLWGIVKDGGWFQLFVRRVSVVNTIFLFFSETGFLFVTALAV